MNVIDIARGLIGGTPAATSPSTILQPTNLSCASTPAERQLDATLRRLIRIANNPRLDVLDLNDTAVAVAIAQQPELLFSLILPLVTADERRWERIEIGRPIQDEQDMNDTTDDGEGHGHEHGQQQDRFARLIRAMLERDNVQMLRLHYLDTATAQVLAQHLTSSRPTSLKTLALYDGVSGLSSDVLKSLLCQEGCPFRVQSLDLSKSRFDSPEAVDVLAAGLARSHVQRLILNGCRMSDDQMAHLVDAAFASGSLLHLDLGRSHCGPAAGTMTALARHLSREDCTLNSLVISYTTRNSINENHDNALALAPLAKALETNTSLTRLDLSHNALQTASIWLMSEMLTRNTTLDILDWSWSQWTEERLCIVALKLGQYQISTIRMDDIMDAPKAAFDPSAFIAAVARNEHMSRLDAPVTREEEEEEKLHETSVPLSEFILGALRFSNMHTTCLTMPVNCSCGSGPIAMNIRYYLQLNRGGRRLLKAATSPASLPLSVLPAMIRHAEVTSISPKDRLNIVFEFLKGSIGHDSLCWLSK